MNEQDQRALWFILHCWRCRKELRILSFRDTRFCFFILFLYFFFSPLKTRATDWSKKRRDSSYSGGLLMSKIWWVFFRLCSDVFFPFSIFLILFRGWHDILKEIEESSSRHGIAVTSSRRGSVIGYFLNRSIFGGRDNFVISLPSSTAHFNWIPHEFSVLLASCLFIKLQKAAHVFFINTLGTTHFNTLVSFVFP